jgi:hypothetical protein
MAEFILNRTFTLRTTNGVISFTKGEPTLVPPLMERDVVAVGGVRADGADVDMEEAQTPAKPIVSGIERQDDIFAAFGLICEKNDSKDFTGQGVPTVKAVEKIVNFDVDRAELVEAWNEYKAKLAEAE